MRDVPEHRSARDWSTSSRRVFVPAYTVVLAANGILFLLAALALFSLAGNPQVQQSRWVFEFAAVASIVVAAVAGCVVILRRRDSAFAPMATALFSVFLALYVPLGTVSFLYWLISIRGRERPPR